VLVAIAILLVLYVVAEALIPVLEAFLHLFVLLGGLAPFLLFIGIGIIIGFALVDD